MFRQLPLQLPQDRSCLATAPLFSSTGPPIETPRWQSPCSQCIPVRPSSPYPHFCQIHLSLYCKKWVHSAIKHHMLNISSSMSFHTLWLYFQHTDDHNPWDAHMEFLCWNTGVANIIQALPNLTREELATFQNAHQKWRISPQNALTM